MKFTTPIDISLVISKTSTVYPGDDQLGVDPLCDITDECPCRITKLGWTTHFLTHVDPPAHFFANGATLDEIPLQRFFVDVHVIEVKGDSVVCDDLDGLILRPGDSVLFKTRNSLRNYGESAFDENHVYISEAAARKMAELQLNLVGLDYISIDQFGNSAYPAHRALLGANIIVLEGLALGEVESGKYRLSALPLKIQKGDGSPVRAILFPLE